MTTLFNDRCAFCGFEINLDNPQNWYELTGWVHGPKKDGLSMRALTGLVAHGPCGEKQKAGQAPDQESLFGDDDA